MTIEAHQREELLAAISTIAVEAGAEIMTIYESDFEVSAKADGSPVTEADDNAERLIVAALEKLTPDIPVVAEERVAHGDVPPIDGREFWLVDALDGTREFISRNGEFTVNIALIDDATPVLGVVHLPVTARLYAGAVELGATAAAGEAPPHAITTREPPPDGVRVVASRSHINAETEAFIAAMPVADLKNAGSSLKFCLVAEGEADIYPRLGRTMEWDTAAGQAVLLAAGGSVTTLAGAPLTYGKPGFENPHFVARGQVGPQDWGEHDDPDVARQRTLRHLGRRRR